jgi:hypothetical protein
MRQKGPALVSDPEGPTPPRTLKSRRILLQAGP